MIGKSIDYLNEINFTDVYAVLVWAAVLLAVAWMILMKDDPANSGLPEWDLRLRRAGIFIMVAGFIVSVLFGGNQGWTPWPPMVLIVFGFDFYLAAAIFTGYRRAKLRQNFAPYRTGRPTVRDKPFFYRPSE